jgi:hypothetical protein
LLNAGEINDLWEKERRQDELWAMLRTHQIEAERDVEIREGAGAPRPYMADFVISCPGGPVIVICDDRQSLGGENVLYLANEELADPRGCVLRIQQAMERVRRTV